MALVQSNPLACMVNNYYDVPNFEDEPFEESQQQAHADEESDVEDEIDTSTPSTDTSAREARNGKDIQAIPWEGMTSTRDEYREKRLKQYKNYRNFPLLRSELNQEYKQVDKGSTFYDFQSNTRLVKPTVVHFQLRNLLWATSKHDVYLMQNFSFMHWSSLLQRGKEVLNADGPVVSTVKRPGFTPRPLYRVQISTLAVKNNLMVAGGFHGELICKHLDRPGVAFATKVTNNDHDITNGVDIYETSNGSTRVMTANNDAQVRIFDVESFALLKNFSFPWSVNSTSNSPDGKLFVVTGDNRDCLIADTQCGKTVGSLKGHWDYSFASAWHPDGNIVATGNQDKSCRLWDVRSMSEPVEVLKGRMGAIRCIKFTSDGKFMAVAEAADFVHVYDTRSGYNKEQEIDLFGEIGGISFSPDTEALFVGVVDRTYGSLMEFNRRRPNYYLDTFI